MSYKRGCEISATEGMDFDWDLTSCLQGGFKSTVLTFPAALLLLLLEHKVQPARNYFNMACRRCRIISHFNYRRKYSTGDAEYSAFSV